MDKKYSEKVELDKFYTKESIAKKCIDSIDIDSYDLIIEPSAGGGSFFNNIDSLNKIGLDLLPESKDIIKQDWFDYKIDNKYKNVLVIGNPPFGKRNKLSGQFIKLLPLYCLMFITNIHFKKTSLRNLD
jgi:16S rRNA A1518/A1519 N6-dimethyltransferase RsmA/KsgA/DIM1 with predicted DNA glycosylase/AP lyase activity